MDNVRVDIDGAIAVVTICRPSVRNAVDGPTAGELAMAFTAFDADPALSVAILTGEGGSFSSGADLKAFADGRGNRVAPDGDGPMGPTRMRLSKPVIAAVEGHAVAGGLELAMWCDLRVAARDATFGVYCRRFGVPLIDGGTVRLSRLIGLSRALDLILTGRGVPAEEAFAIGLVNRLVNRGCALDGARELALTLSGLPQACLRSDRLSTLEADSLDIEAAMDNELRRGLAVIASGETSDGAARFTRGEGRHGAPATDPGRNEGGDGR